LLVGRKENGLTASIKKTKYMVMSRQQNVGQNHYIKVRNKSSEKVGKFKYL